MGELYIDGVLFDVRNEQQAYASREYAQRARHEKWVLALFDNIVAGCSNDIWKDCSLISVPKVKLLQSSHTISANKSADLADCSCDGVVLTTDRCCGGFGRNKANVVTWPKLPKRQKDAIDDNEAADLTRVI